MNPGLKAWDYYGDLGGVSTPPKCRFLKYPALKGGVSAGGRINLCILLIFSDLCMLYVRKDDFLRKSITLGSFLPFRGRLAELSVFSGVEARPPLEWKR